MNEVYYKKSLIIIWKPCTLNQGEIAEQDSRIKYLNKSDIFV